MLFFVTGHYYSLEVLNSVKIYSVEYQAFSLIIVINFF